MNEVVDNMLMHYGIKMRSGRYPYGSGKDPYQHSGDFLGRINELKSQGFTEKEIADYFDLSTTQFRAEKALAKDEYRSLRVDTAQRLRDQGYSLNEIAVKMGFANDSSVRTLLNEKSKENMETAKRTADIIKEAVDTKGMIDVGVGVEKELGVSKEKLVQAIHLLEMEGYELHGAGVPQVTNPGQQTIVKVICPPGTEHKEVYNFGDIHSINEYAVTKDGGETFDKYEYPKSMDSSRLKIRYAEEGGVDKDGLVEIRPGVQDLSLGNSMYSQVRILVDNDRYIKGMAVYSDDIPDGYDIIFNTNKHSDVSKRDVLKKIKDDPDNPFGSLIMAGGQSHYIDQNGERQLSLINKRSDEGEWDKWSNKVASQFLSKQNITLAKKQLKLTEADKVAEYDEILSLDNPTIKRTLLQSFADDCDGAAIHLKAAAFPRSKYRVLLPENTLKETEVYAPSYKNGEKVALVRYPHGGTFEIPVLTVNNKNEVAKKMIGTNPIDAVCINSKVAGQLSGADFDGDACLVIPTNSKIKITATKPLKDLKGFEPKEEYGTTKGSDGNYYNTNGSKIKVMNNTQNEMGKISNLITDMTLKGAAEDEIARAVKHSMVVIDAEKHKLDYRKSEIDNGISALKKKYQGGVDENGKYHEGASTLISRAKSEVDVLKRKGAYKPDPETGKLLYKEVEEHYIDKNGNGKIRTQKSTKMAETDDARTLLSGNNHEGTEMERVYADYANKMKAMANDARKEMMSTGRLIYSSEAKAKYSKEVETLEAKLRVAELNAPRERRAQMLANSIVKAKQQDNPDMTKEELKKERQRAINSARNSLGAKREPVEINDKEWEAIQAGAISDTKLSQMLKYTDIDKLKERATPRERTTLSQAKISKLKAMSNSGYTTAEIAESMGVSTSTVSKYIK